MATLNSIPEHRQSPSAMRGVMDYCRQQEKVHDPVSGRDLVSGIHCGGATAYDEFMLTKQVYGKTGGVLFYQFTQSFDSRSTISSVDAHALALEFAERAWPGHEVLVCTHCDTDNPHSHFVINSVSWQDGRKLHMTPAGFRNLRELSDELCLVHGYPVVKPRETQPQGMSAREVPVSSQGGELEAPADVRHRPVHATGADTEGVRGRAPTTGICGPMDGGAEVHHLHDAHRHEVQRQQAARRKISEGGDGT